VTTLVAPLHDALLHHARADAESVLAAAEARVARMLADADREGAALIERARAEGIAVAEREAAREQALARREQRALLLAGRRQVYEELQAALGAAVQDLRNEPGYPALLQRLAAAAREQLGDDATIELDAPGGGVRASKGPRHVDYTLDALGARALERLAPDLEKL
jgi:vacuolar-type H+-ATPase subunit E/Vma4